MSDSFEGKNMNLNHKFYYLQNENHSLHVTMKAEYICLWWVIVWHSVDNVDSTLKAHLWQDRTKPSFQSPSVQLRLFIRVGDILPWCTLTQAHKFPAHTWVTGGPAILSQFRNVNVQPKISNISKLDLMSTASPLPDLSGAQWWADSITYIHVHV